MSPEQIPAADNIGFLEQGIRLIELPGVVWLPHPVQSAPAQNPAP